MATAHRSLREAIDGCVRAGIPFMGDKAPPLGTGTLLLVADVRALALFTHYGNRNSPCLELLANSAGFRLIGALMCESWFRRYQVTVSSGLK